MNPSEQICEKLKTKTLGELERQIPLHLFSGDKLLLQEVQELLKSLADKTERALKMCEIGSDLLQEGRSSLEGDLSSRGNKLDDEALQDKFVSGGPQDEPHRDTLVVRIPPQDSTVVYYIDDSNHNSNEGYYKDNPNEDTRFQITVDQTDPYVGILQFYDRIEEGVKKEFKQASLSLINNVRGQYPGSNTSGSIKDGEVRLDPERKHWELKTPITIKS